VAQALVGRNIHRSVPTRAAVAPNRFAPRDQEVSERRARQHEISDDVFPVKRFKLVRKHL